MPLPEFSIILERGKTFTPPPENYILQVDDNVRCLGLKPITGPLPSIIGNLLQKKFFVQYNVQHLFLDLLLQTVESIIEFKLFSIGVSSLDKGICSCGLFSKQMEINAHAWN